MGRITEESDQGCVEEESFRGNRRTGSGHGCVQGETLVTGLYRENDQSRVYTGRTSGVGRLQGERPMSGVKWRNGVGSTQGESQ